MDLLVAWVGKEIVGSAKPAPEHNAPMENFFHRLKVEQVHHDDYRTRDEARSAIFDYIEIFYNRQRKYFYIDYQSPVDFEKTTCCITECAWNRGKTKHVPVSFSWSLFPDNCAILNDVELYL